MELLPNQSSGPFLGSKPGAKTLCLGQGGSFPTWVHPVNNKISAETETAQTLYNGQRMEKRELSLQVNFSTQLSGDTE